MKKLILFALILVVISTSFAEKKSKPVMKINDQFFTVDEFKFVYNKNNQLSQSPLSPQEYLDLFVNYKLKVKEAEAQGIDTTKSFLKEFNYYKDELAKPYLTDKKAEEDVIKEAYDRLTQEVSASHILIRFPSIPTPEDTLKAYNKALEVMEKIKKGESFDDLALNYSEDPSAKSNSGKLGYFTGFNMVYPFETAAFNTPVGKISDIVRTNFGYHIIKVHDKRPASGEMNAAHIMKAFPRNSTDDVQNKAKITIDSIYQLIQQGGNFEELANKYSDDRNSAANGGEIGWFSFGRMIPEFAEPAFNLKNDNDISKPIKTPFGWHIIKRLGHKNLASFDEMKETITKRIASDQRAYAGQEAVLKRIKTNYNYKQLNDNLDTLKSLLTKKDINDSVFYTSASIINNPVITFNNHTYSVAQFANFIHTGKNFNVKRGSLELDKQLDEFGKKMILDYEKENLIKNYPDYKYLVSEYHDGLLIFEISQKEIWNKASADTTGLEIFFEKNKANYPKPEAWKGTIIYCKNDSVKNIISKLKSNVAEINDSILSANNIKKGMTKIEKGEFVKGKKDFTDVTFFNDTTKNTIYPNGYNCAITEGNILPAGMYTLSEIRGQVLSDYQNEIEKNWIAELRNKYAPKIYYNTVKKIKPVIK
ncbi:MAG: peptidylprolyl isomerase [Marinilabiliaceae bacterium]|nr:peptidylprolyl isomerase [Marinilabiliaceae bacterium]